MNTADRRIFSLFIVCAAVVAAAPELALAASSGHDAHGHHAPSIWDIRWYWFNFLVYVGAMFYLLRGPAVAAWNSRRTNLIESIQGAKRDLEVAQARFAEAQTKVSRVEAEKSEMARRLRSETEKEVQQIAHDAVERAQRIARQAEMALQHERKALEGKLRRELALVVTEKARERLKREVTPEHDRSLRDASLGGVKGLLH